MWRRAVLAVSLAFSLADGRLAVRELESAARSQLELEAGMTTAVVKREVNDANAYVATVMATLRTASRELEHELDLAAASPNASSAATGAPKAGIARAQTAGVHRFLPGAQKRLKEQEDLLKNLFAHLKSSVTHSNKNEKENKDENAKLVKSQEEKIKADHEKLKNPKLSAHDRERLVNRTQADERTLTYFKRGRDLQHSMFHSNLKIAHGLMSRVKNVLEIYTESLAKGQIDAKARALLKTSMESVPRALLETQHKLRRTRRAGRRLHTAAWYERWVNSPHKTGRRLFHLRKHA